MIALSERQPEAVPSEAFDDDPLAKAEPAIADDERVVRDAIETIKAEEKPNAALDDSVIEAMARIHAAEPALHSELRLGFKRLCQHGVRVGELDKHESAKARELGLTEDVADEKTLADALADEIERRAEAFIDLEGEPHLTIRESPRKTMLLRSKAAREWMAFISYTELERAASDAVLSSVAAALAGIAAHGGSEPRAVYLRAAPSPDGNGYYVDMCDDAWRAIHVTASGWCIVEEPPVCFRRTQTMRPLPTPTRGGNLDRLWIYANIPENMRGIVLAWMLEAWRPDTAFPVLELIGGHGKAKSSTQERLRDLVDPNAAPLRAAPKDVESVFVGANTGWLASYNNLSRLTPAMQDAFCILATGGGYAARTLYTNKDESLIEARRPVVINGINGLVTAQDLIDRTIRVELPTITERRREADLKRGFERDYPAILGALLDLFSVALARLPSVELADPPRMADFAHLGQAVYQALDDPRDFCRHYAEVRLGAVAAGLESSPAARALLEMMEDERAYNGTAKGLLERLTSRYKPDGADGWPKSARGLTEVLRRQEAALETLGVKVALDPVRHRDGYHVRVEYVSSPPRIKSRIDVHNIHNVHEASNGAASGREHRVNIGESVNIDVHANDESVNIYPRANDNVHGNVHAQNPHEHSLGERRECCERLSAPSTLAEKEGVGDCDDAEKNQQHWLFRPEGKNSGGWVTHSSARSDPGEVQAEIEHRLGYGVEVRRAAA